MTTGDILIETLTVPCDSKRRKVRILNMMYTRHSWVSLAI